MNASPPPLYPPPRAYILFLRIDYINHISFIRKYAATTARCLRVCAAKKSIDIANLCVSNRGNLSNRPCHLRQSNRCFSIDELFDDAMQLDVDPLSIVVYIIHLRSRSADSFFFSRRRCRLAANQLKCGRGRVLVWSAASFADKHGCRGQSPFQ